MRKALTDGTGQWFSEDKSEYFPEKTYWNGNNWISQVTNAQGYHEGLYLTKGGKFILRKYCDYVAATDQFIMIEKDDAAVWFSNNGDEPHPKCEKEFNALEIE